MQQRTFFGRRLRALIIGKARRPEDSTVFHKISLIAFFAWIGLGADGISSSCYGPEEAFRALGAHPHLGILVALATAGTILVISASYSQIIELFPSGGGGYLVASKLLSPGLGMVSGCALLLDYVLTISISIASGTDALFSFLPGHWHLWKIEFAVAGIVLLMVLNLRGVKESVVPLAPIFLTFVIMHAFAILYAVGGHLISLPDVVRDTIGDYRQTQAALGFWGMLFLVMRAYSMGAGTYTGIEAVSNGIPVLREPKVQTARRTMRYMAFSLTFLVVGLMLSYLLYRVSPQEGKTLNAVLFEKLTATWGSGSARSFVLVILVSEAIILFVAAQTGFLDGPRVLSNMALDRWVPTKFATLSDRLVTQNGILLMGTASLITVLLARGSVRFLVVLYSINVFITFALSQTGMVRHWWQVRSKNPQWRKKMLVNGVGLILTGFILVSVVLMKFYEGGWITLLVTTALVIAAIAVRRHYNQTFKLLRRLDSLVAAAESDVAQPAAGRTAAKEAEPTCDPNAQTAVILVNGFGGLGLHTLFSVIRLFGGVFKNYVFMSIGMVDAGTFKGAAEMDLLRAKVNKDVDRYVAYMRRKGYCAEGVSSVGIDIVDEVAHTAATVRERFPHAVFFGGQLVFEKDTFVTRWLHNYTAFAIQRRFYRDGIPVIILPIRV